MKDQIAKVFFYGLFMDAEILRKKGIEAKESKMASLSDHKLIIGERASLIPLNEHTSYGILMKVEKALLDELYAEESVKDYVPTKVKIQVLQGSTEAALCYLLPATSIKGTNTEYAHKLLELGKRLEFPVKYLKQIRSFIK